MVVRVWVALRVRVWVCVGGDTDVLRAVALVVVVLLVQVVVVNARRVIRWMRGRWEDGVQYCRRDLQ
jgi:hypothetical protein